MISGNTPGDGDGTDWGTLYTTDHPEGIMLASSAQYAALSVNDTGPIVIGGESIPRTNIIGYAFGRNCQTAGDYFLRNCTQLSKITHLEQLRIAGDGFLYDCTNLNTALDFSSLEKIGYNFLGNCKSFNSPIRFPKLATMSLSFMSGCPRFAQRLVIPGSVSAVSNNVLQGCGDFIGPLVIETSAIPNSSYNYSLCASSNTDASYAVGVLLQGHGAKAWKEALPDMAESGGSGRYRKLILDPEWA